jgi:hypothetical protein
MTKRTIVAAMLLSAGIAGAQTAKKDLVQKLLTLQQPGIEQVSRNLVERPAMQMMQEAGLVLQRQIASEKREALGKQIEVEVKKYVDESVPLVRERALKLAPTTIGPLLEEKFSEDELKQLIAWLESPINKKYQQFGPEMEKAFLQKLVADARPMVEPKIKELDGRMRAVLGVPPAQPASAASATSGATRAAPPPPPPPPVSTPKAPPK